MALLFAVLFVIASVSCTNPENVNSDEANSPDNSAATDSGSDTEESAKLELPELDYEGETITIFGDEYIMQQYLPMYFDEEGSEVVREAAYRRNSLVEEKLNVKIEFVGNEKSGSAPLINSVLAQDGAYNTATAMNSNITPAIIAGAMLDLNNVSYINIEKPWYLSYVNKEMNMLGSQFTVCGYFDMATFARTCVFFFSTQLAIDNSLGNLYELVNDNTWTYDKMLELAEQCYSDLDGDGVMTPVDCFGATGGFNMNSLLITTTGYRFTTKTDTSAKATGVTDLLVNFNEKLIKLSNADFYYNCYPQGGENNFDGGAQVFTENRSLFFIQDISYSERFAKNMDDYGILPAPKYSESQKDYTCFCRPALTGIPTDCPDANRSGAVIEALNYYSMDTVRPAYCETALSVKYAKSEEAGKIVNMIFQNVACDFVQAWYTSLDITPPLHNSVGYMENYSSWFKSIETKFNTKMDEIFDKVLEIQDIQGIS